MFRRILILDPNLIKPSGHPAQFCSALEQTCRNLGLESYVLTNRGIQPKAAALFQNLRAAITYSSFEVHELGSTQFAADLLEAHMYYELGYDDLLLITSAHINEVAGAAIYERTISTGHGPAIALNFHQLYPPVAPSSLATAPEYQRHWLEKLAESFSSLKEHNSRISLWTTSVAGLNRMYRRISGRRVGELPVIFAAVGKAQAWEPLAESSARWPIMAFLGDGRREKGLLLFLMAIKSLRSVNLSFCLQNVDARGYEDAEWKLFQELLNDIRTLPRVTLIDQSLSNRDFLGLLQGVDILALPYEPFHYRDRASAMFIQAAREKKPVIVSDSTWMATELRRGRAGGVVFRHCGSDANHTATNFARAILRLKRRFSEYQEIAQRSAAYYQHACAPERYLNIVVNHYVRD